MKHNKKLLGFFSGLVITNIYFAIDDQIKINKIRTEIKEIQDRNNGQITYGRRY